MLVLGRKQSESLILKHRTTGERIVVMLVRGGDSPRIGVEATLEWQILRDDAKNKDDPNRFACCNEPRQE